MIELPIPGRRLPRRAAVVVTCEHASNRVPPRLQRALGLNATELAGHQAYDLGAASVARELAAALGAPCVLGRVSRLVVDLNRSPGNPGLWSAAARRLPDETRTRLLREHHGPHWDEVRARLAECSAGGVTVVHLAVHSFTPVMRGHRRTMDIGILYDPSRPLERALAKAWKSALRRVAPHLIVRRNAPYRGVDDGMTRSFRREIRDPLYAGIELELNQKWIVPGVDSGRFDTTLASAVLASAREFLAPSAPTRSATPRSRS
jgi:predicted N-formylglutamate amidohydrolase